MHETSRIFVAGGSGLVGSALVRRLSRERSIEVLAPRRSEVDLENERAVYEFLGDEQPDTVILAAALVGGIGANREHPVEFLTRNLMIQNNVMLGAQQSGVRTLMFLGSSCIYPRESPQPMRESYYMTGPLEPTNESYAVAKIAGIRLANALKEQHRMQVILPMPSNIYGPGDHFDPENSHVLSALVMKFDNARRLGAPSVTLWGTGVARREFLHCDDLADACVFLMGCEEDLGIINVGFGDDVSIADLAYMVGEMVGYRGEILWDDSKPDGMPRKLMDVQRLSALGWSAKTTLQEGIPQVIEEYRRLFPED